MSVWFNLNLTDSKSFKSKNAAEIWGIFFVDHSPLSAR
jgi:hypothetical protein